MGCAVIVKCHCGGLEISGTRVRRDSVAARVNVAQVCAGHTFSQSQRLIWKDRAEKRAETYYGSKRDLLLRIAGILGGGG